MRSLLLLSVLRARRLPARRSRRVGPPLPSSSPRAIRRQRLQLAQCPGETCAVWLFVNHAQVTEVMQQYAP